MNTRRITEKVRMFDNLLSWETLAASCLTILGIIITAAIYEWIGNPKILWLIVACLIGLEIYFTHGIITYLEQRNLKRPASTTSPSTAPSTQTTKPAISRDNPGRTFEVLQAGLGEWAIGFRFTEYDFRYTVIAAVIHNNGPIAAAPRDWSATCRRGNGGIVKGEWVHPPNGDNFLFRAAPLNCRKNREDWWPRKLEMNTIPPGGYGWGFVIFRFPGIVKDEFNGWSVILEFKDGRGTPYSAVPINTEETKTGIVGVNHSIWKPPAQTI